MQLIIDYREQQRTLLTLVFDAAGLIALAPGEQGAVEWDRLEESVDDLGNLLALCLREQYFDVQQALELKLDPGSACRGDVLFSVLFLAGPPHCDLLLALESLEPGGYRKILKQCAYRDRFQQIIEVPVIQAQQD
ncbi:MAG: hypothetical protein GAK44_00177 [Pseudomonas delhiensis]|nr:MAG: hypothetical protein GAK44_00177 [Pseudomonas delhiensis]